MHIVWDKWCTCDIVLTTCVGSGASTQWQPTSHLNFNDHSNSPIVPEMNAVWLQPADTILILIYCSSFTIVGLQRLWKSAWPSCPELPFPQVKASPLPVPRQNICSIFMNILFQHKTYKNINLQVCPASFPIYHLPLSKEQKIKKGWSETLIYWLSFLQKVWVPPQPPHTRARMPRFHDAPSFRKLRVELGYTTWARAPRQYYWLYETFQFIISFSQTTKMLSNDTRRVEHDYLSNWLLLKSFGHSTQRMKPQYIIIISLHHLRHQDITYGMLQHSTQCVSVQSTWAGSLMMRCECKV